MGSKLQVSRYNLTFVKSHVLLHAKRVAKLEFCRPSESMDSGISSIFSAVRPRASRKVRSTDSVRFVQKRYATTFLPCASAAQTTVSIALVTAMACTQRRRKTC